jgi:hypothetical protein
VIVFAVVVLVLGVVLVRRRRRKMQRALSSDVMTDVLGTTGLYRGRRWEVGDRWWL